MTTTKFAAHEPVRRAERSSGFSMEERLSYSNFTVKEACLVETRKIGRKTVIAGPALRAYLALGR
jgi:hypothetical protein